VTKILKADLQAPADRFMQMETFYSGILGVPASETGFQVGSSQLVFTASEATPYYHFAMLVPCNRFEAACAWADERVHLLPVDRSGAAVSYFENWDAQSVYFHDPAANIVELIAHAGNGESAASGDFTADELMQLSEIGLVGDKRALVGAVCSLGAEVSAGSVEDDEQLVFVGPPTSSIIISPADRGWMPLGRPAERYPVELTLLGESSGEVIASGHRIRQLQATE
jgi:hypothetical protein